MGNHYHVLIESPHPNLMASMRRLNGVYTQAFNYRRKKPGHVFQGQCQSILVEKDRYVQELCRSIVVNPVAGRARRIVRGCTC
jgi:putative transposase